MNKRAGLFSIVVAGCLTGAGLVSGCSNSSSPTSTEEAGVDAKAEDGKVEDAKSKEDAKTEDAGDAGCSGPNVAITVYNFKAWCALAVDGTAISPGTLGTTTKTSVCVAPGSALSAEPNGTNFEIGTPPLPFISGTKTVKDDAGTASTTLATGATCVFACCPFANSDAATGGCSGLTDPCR
jgi:hypothetical protein